MLHLSKSEREIAATFNSRFEAYGPTPEASLWFNKSRQLARFSKLTEAIVSRVSNNEVTIGDVGCGYGAFLDYLAKHNSEIRFKYYGYDIADRVIAYCSKNLQTANATFLHRSRPTRKADFHVMSGTYNYTPNMGVGPWRSYMRDEIKYIFSATNKCIVFNLMLADKAYISKSSIFYEEVEHFLSFCRKELGETTILEHPLLRLEKTFCIEK
jgi:SAM-dependent methyltransferase